MTLAAERNPPIEEVIKTGVIPKFVEFLQRHDTPQLQVGVGPHSQMLHLVLHLSVSLPVCVVRLSGYFILLTV